MWGWGRWEACRGTWDLGDGSREEERNSVRIREKRGKSLSSGPCPFLTSPKASWVLLVPGSLSSSVHRSAWCLSLLLYMAAPFTCPQGPRQLQRLPGLSCCFGAWWHQMEKLRMRGAGAAWAWASAEQAWEPGRHDTIHTGQGLIGDFSALAEILAV